MSKFFSKDEERRKEIVLKIMLFDPIFLDFPSIFYLWRGGMLRKIYFFRSIKGKQTGREEKERMVENRRRKEEMGAQGEAWKRRRLLEKITVRFRHLVNLWPWVRSCVRSLDRSWLKPLANLYHVSTSYRREKASNHQPSLPQNLTRLPSLSISISSPTVPSFSPLFTPSQLLLASQNTFRRTDSRRDF